MNPIYCNFKKKKHSKSMRILIGHKVFVIKIQIFHTQKFHEWAKDMGKTILVNSFTYVDAIIKKEKKKVLVSSFLRINQKMLNGLVIMATTVKKNSQILSVSDMEHLMIRMFLINLHIQGIKPRWLSLKTLTRTEVSVIYIFAVISVFAWFLEQSCMDLTLTYVLRHKH